MFVTLVISVFLVWSIARLYGVWVFPIDIFQRILNFFLFLADLVVVLM